jgi:hypothetical protein
MIIEDIIESKKSDIIEKWFDLTAQSYSSDTAHFLKSQKDPFANPVGSNIFSCLKSLMDCLIKNHDNGVIKNCLDPIIRIRAVQTIFSPSQAVSFIFDLKKILKDALRKELKDDGIKDGLLLFETRVDNLGLIAFDIFMECREKIYDLKANFEKNKFYRAFERAGLISEL